MVALRGCSFRTPRPPFCQPSSLTSNYHTRHTSSLSPQTAGGGTGEEDSEAGRHLTAQDLLLKLPGVTVSNFRSIMKRVDNLAALSRMSVAELHPILESEAAAKKLHDFLHHNPNRQRQGGVKWRKRGGKQGRGGGRR